MRWCGWTIRSDRAACACLSGGRGRFASFLGDPRPALLRGAGQGVTAQVARRSLCRTNRQTDVNAPLRPPEPRFTQPRAEGAASLRVLRHGAETRLADLRLQGSMKLLFPRPAPARPFEAVMLNTAGGLTGGDRMAVQAAAGPGARLTLSTQAAERAYRAPPGTGAEVTVRLTAGPGAVLHWLPQETILYDGAALSRRLTADLSGDATLLLVEPLVFGRRAMGERLHGADLTDRWEIRRDGRLVAADALRLSAMDEATLDCPAIAGPARAAATVLLAAPGAEARLPAIRALLPVTAGASTPRDGVLFIRILAPDGHALRRALEPLLTALTGAALPRVWRL